MVIVVVIVSSSVLFCDVVDSFHFRAVWIISTRRLIVGVIVVIIVVVVIVIVLFVVIVLLSSSLVCPTRRLSVSSSAEPFVSGAGTLAWYTLALLSLAWTPYVRFSA